MRTLVLRITVPAVLLVLTGCSTQPKSSADDVKKFLDDAEVRLNDLGVEAGRASWVQENFITDDTEALSAAASQRDGDESVRVAKQAKQFDGVQVPADQARKLNLLKIGPAARAAFRPQRKRRGQQARRLSRRHLREGQILQGQGVA